MLPNIRALFGAIVAAVALMMISFGVVATFRVAQDARVGMLQADLAQRGRQDARIALLVDKPAPLEANPVPAVEIEEAPGIPEQAPQTPVAVVLAMPEPEPPVAELPAIELAATKMSAIEPPSAEPPMGGPLAQETPIHSGQPGRRAADAIAARNAKKKAEQAAARKARAQRLASERKAAARKARAAQARAKRQSARSFDNAPFSNSFGAFNNSTSSNSPSGNGTFGNGTFGTSASGQ